MRRFVIDTNIVINVTRSLDFQAFLHDEFDFFNPANELILSLVSVAELRSLNGRSSLGERRMLRQLNFFKQISILAPDKRMLVPYANIDNFSLGKLPNRPSSVSAIKMGKNDLWIAATAVVENAELITTDKDFIHLNGEFLTVHYVD